MELRSSIQVVNEYKQIMFRKFFQILFINEDMKSIDIYTAIIVGGANRNSEHEEYRNYYSQIEKGFAIKFNFDLDLGSKSNSDYTVTHKDYTDSFFKQIEKTRKIWGEKSELIEDQSTLKDKLQKVFDKYRNYTNCKNCNCRDGNKNCKNCDRKNDCLVRGKSNTECVNCKNYDQNELQDELTKITPERKEYLYTCDEEEKDISLAIKGKFEKAEENDEPKNCFSVRLDNDVHEGVEIVNWVHTKIAFNKKQNFDRMNYVINFPNVRIWVPDFTLYVGPPEGTVVDLNTSGVKVDTIDKRDALQEVGTFEELYYDEWIKNCNVMNKRMFRALKDRVFKMDRKVLDSNQLKLIINLKDEGGKEKFQFILGIVLSTLLAFGIDCTRMNGLDKCFIPNFVFPDLQWLLACILAIYVIMKTWKCNVSVRKDIITLQTFKELFTGNKKWKTFKKMLHLIVTAMGGFGLLCFIVWFFMTFLLSRSSAPDNQYKITWIQKVKWLDLNNLDKYIPRLLRDGLISCLGYAIGVNTFFKKDYSPLWHKYKIRF